LQASEPHVKACFVGRKVTLTGVVSINREYGPPNWGETPKQDSRWTMVVLTVTSTAANSMRSLLPGCFEPTRNLTKVQLWSPSGWQALSQYRGVTVRVVGSLTPASGAPAELLAAQVRVFSISPLAAAPNKSVNSDTRPGGPSAGYLKR